MPLTVGSTFSGIGGFELAAMHAGMVTLWSCEINSDAQQVLKHHFPEAALYDDITTIGSHNVEPVDVLTGGFPCQDLSVAGKRAGLAGKRSGLFYEFIRVAEEIRPEWIVLENVPGLLSSNGGRDMGAVVGTLVESGYGVAWRVLDAQYSGVPQRRRRVVIVGHLGDASRAGKVLFESEGLCGDTPPSREARAQALTANGVGTCGADDNQAQAGHLLPVPSLIASTLQGGDKRGYRIDAEGAAGGHWDQVTPSDLCPVVVRTVRATTGQKGDGDTDTFIPVYAPEIAASLTSQLSATPGVNPPGRRQEDDVNIVAFSENQQAAVIEHDVFHALSTGGGKPGQGYPAFRHGLAVRRLMPIECERLQGFPDGWTEVPNAKGKSMSDSARYRMLGNAIAVPVFAWVLSRINESGE